MLNGIDVSRWQRAIDWEKLKSDKRISFAYIKACDGIGAIDPMFIQHFHGAKSAGLLVGAYMWFKPGVAGAIQAENYLEHTKGFELDLPMALDWEEKTDVNRTFAIQRAADCLVEIEKETGVRPIIYTGFYYFNELGNPGGFARYPLWLAQYRSGEPTIPRPWERATFWQNSDCGRDAALKGRYDTDIFFGSLDDLKALGQKQAPAPVPA